MKVENTYSKQIEKLVSDSGMTLKYILENIYGSKDYNLNKRKYFFNLRENRFTLFDVQTFRLFIKGTGKDRKSIIEATKAKNQLKKIINEL